MPLGGRLSFWDEGRGPGLDFRGSMPTMQGWHTWERETSDPTGIDIRSKEAIARWKSDKYSSAISFCESYIMAHKKGAVEGGAASARKISATEGARLLGFPVG